MIELNRLERGPAQEAEAERLVRALQERRRQVRPPILLSLLVLLLLLLWRQWTDAIDRSIDQSIEHRHHQVRPPYYYHHHYCYCGGNGLTPSIDQVRTPYIIIIIIIRGQWTDAIDRSGTSPILLLL